MNPVLIVLAICVFLYLFQTLFIYIGTHRLNYPRTKSLPAISILVALRDEEQTLEPCVESLLQLDYPTKSFEILLINDRSSDRTPELIEELKKKSERIKTLHIKTGIPGLSGKANAIAQGMENCSGELILVTDGDCRVPANWAKTHAAYYQKDVGLVGGFTLLDKKNDPSYLFGKIQSLDWAYLLSVGSGFMGFGIPLSVLGNNFSFRRQAYEEVGGYRNMGFTIIEDFALMKTLVKKTLWKVLYPIDSKMLVYSQPMPDFKAFYNQRKRWSAGGKEVGLYGKSLMFISVMVHMLIPISFFVFDLRFSFLALIIVLLADFGLLCRTTGLVQRRDLLKYFLLWEGFYFLYTILFTPVLLFPTTVKWKNISYSWKFNWKLKKMSG
ncbi:glycosyltransferase [candidate division KSB1 bacterium]|nr:glycosyltransferase [candidate division KSB1 bacterium]